MEPQDSRPARPSAVTKGRSGESAAAELMESEGWGIVARNFRAGPGEIDVIAWRDPVLVFLEVKSWARYGPGELGLALNAKKCRRIVETSKIFLCRNRQYSKACIRYDVMLFGKGTLLGRYESAFTGVL